MPLRFFRRIKIAPGLHLNLGKRGGSISVGPRGAKLTAGTGGLRATGGLPGTGLWMTERIDTKRPRSRSRRDRPSPPPGADALELGFLERLLTPKAEEDLVDGLRAFVEGRRDEALGFLHGLSDDPDAMFVAAILDLERDDLAAAETCLQHAWSKRGELGRTFERYGLDVAASAPITPEVTLALRPDETGVLLLLAEIHQARGEPAKAVDCAKAAWRSDPEDLAARLSFAELLLEVVEQAPSRAEEACERIVELAAGVENRSEPEAALLLHRGVALRHLGMHVAARDALTAALRRRKDRAPELLRAARYERALVYEALGRRTRARREFERIWAEDPGYEDVAERVRE